MLPVNATVAADVVWVCVVVRVDICGVLILGALFRCNSADCDGDDGLIIEPLLNNIILPTLVAAIVLSSLPT